MKRIRLGNTICFSLLILLFTININAIPNYELREDSNFSALLSDYEMLNPPNNLTDYSIKEVDHYDTGFGYMLDLLVVDNLAFTNVFRGGLLVFNVSDLTTPLLIGSYDEPRAITEDNLWGNYGGIGNGLTIKNDLVFLCGGLTGLLIINISDPTNPQKVGHYRDSATNDVIVNHNYVYCLSYPGLVIIDISQPSDPFFIKSITDQEFSTGLIYEYVIQNNYLFTLGSELVIFDISDPSNLFEVGRLEVDLGKIVIDENQLFIITSPTPYNSFSSNLNIINISTPYNPTLIFDPQINEIEAFVDDIMVKNSTIFVSSETKLFAFNLSIDYNVTLLSSLTVSGSIGKIQIQHNFFTNETEYDIAFCANSRGLQIVDITNASQPLLLAEYDLGSRAMGVFAAENYLYICVQHEFPSKPSSFMIFKIINGTLQLTKSFTFENDTITDIFVHNQYAFLAGYNSGLIVLNIENPYEPTIIGTYSEGVITTKAIFFDHINDFVFLANYESGYSIINVTDKTNPSLLYRGNYWGMSIVDLYVENDLLYLANNYLQGGFGIVNVSDPSHPIHIQARNMEESVFSIYAKENLLYLSTDLTPLIIYDIQYPSEPVFLGELYTGKWFDGYGLSIKGNLAYVAREANGLMVIDIDNPRNPKLLVEYRDYYAGLSYDVTAFGAFIFLADGWDGLEILTLNPPIISLRKLLVISILPPIIGGLLVLVILISVVTKRRR